MALLGHENGAVVIGLEEVYHVRVEVPVGVNEAMVEAPNDFAYFGDKKVSSPSTIKSLVDQAVDMDAPATYRAAQALKTSRR